VSVQIASVGILHPGSMGAAVARELAARGVRVLWNRTGRSAETVRRAQDAGLEAVDGLGRLVAVADLVISLCPPAAAEDVARDVARHRRENLVFLEANAVNPQRVHRISRILSPAVTVDGAVIGSPPRVGRPPRLYISGSSEHMEAVCELFSGTAVDVRVLPGGMGRASSLKLSYTSFQKASRVLAAVAFATADAEGLGAELLDVAALRSTNYLSEADYVPTTAALAWRWAPELDEAADHARDAGFPDAMIRAAARVLEQWAHLHDCRPPLSEAIELLKHPGSPDVPMRPA